ncbi:hypothetical protein [Hymenobacter saemangeumensis]|uniref:hypothetical protein n=1 Tax=Hymenobacter saemangeumensis TaxID=1084522 RepID=UPI0031EECF2C
MEQAIVAGLAYLRQHQYPNGEFCCYYAPDDPMQEWCQPDSALFPTALVAGCMLSLQALPVANDMLTSATNFLQYQMLHGGLWTHYGRAHAWHRLCPPDVDDTSCVSAIMRARGIDCPHPSNVPLLLTNRNREGLFFTWFLLRLRWNANRTYWRVVLPELLRPVQSFVYWREVEAHRNDVDAGVNANVLFYLGDRPETQPVIAWLLRIIAENREAECDRWYRDPFFIYYFFTRCYHAGIQKLEPLRAPIIARILAQAQPDGRLGTTLADTAWAVCSLLNLGSYPIELEKAVQYLLRHQNNSGEWPRWRLYYGGPKKAIGWGSEELTTGFCLEALARYQQHITSG